MATTDNYKLAQLELTSSANFPVLLNNTFKTIDKGLTLDVGSSTGTGNDYVLNLGSITLSSANKGISFKFWADKDSNGAVTINGTYHLVKASGNPVKNLKRNAPYTITYDGGTDFFLSSGGADESDSTTVGTDGSKVLFGETFIGSDGEIHTGKIRNRTAVNTTLEAGQSIILYSGYYKDKSTIKAETLATAMSNAGVTLTSASQLVKGVKAVNKNGSLITGTATIQSLGGSSFVSGTGSITLTEHQPHIWVDFSEKVPSNVRVIWGKFNYHINEYLFVNFRSETSGTFISIVWNRHFSSYYKQSSVDITKICLGEGDSCHNWPAETYTYTWYAI